MIENIHFRICVVTDILYVFLYIQLWYGLLQCVVSQMSVHHRLVCPTLLKYYNGVRTGHNYISSIVTKSRY